ncbi:MAG: hypothetical protein P8Y00_00060 [Deltaproteobacteria bacterium]
MQKKRSAWKEYDVTVRATGCDTVRVKARNPYEAMKKAEDKVPDIDTELQVVSIERVPGKKSLTFEDIHTFEDPCALGHE